MKHPLLTSSIGFACLTLLLAPSSLSAATHYVSLESANPTPPYTNWATAATNIQDAVDAAAANDVVMVTNGVYPGGVTVTNPLMLLSVNGPQVTLIDGGGSDYCSLFYVRASLTGFTLTNGSLGAGSAKTTFLTFLTNCVITRNGWGTVGCTLSACTLTGNTPGAVSCTLYNCALSGNWAEGSLIEPAHARGAGAYECTLYNCTLTGNGGIICEGGGAAYSTLYNCTLTSNHVGMSSYGGGAAGCTLYNCTLTDNSADASGGGACGCTLYNCTVTGNSAQWGGGAALSTLYDSIAYLNTSSASGGANYDNYSTLNYCCTTPMPTNGFGNITNAPLFVDYASGNLRLQSNSPCINAGNNSYLTDSYFTNCFDLDGNPRIASGTVDMGAYEFQGPGSVISYAWLQQYGLPIDGSADFAHADADGMNNWQEWICGTCPTNPLSVLRLLSVTSVGTNVTATWQSVAGLNYVLERSPDLGSPFTLLATGIPGQAGITAYADTNVTGTGPFFYRVGVHCP